MKSIQLRILLLSSYLISVVFGDWQYRSRPDLAPPKLNITILPNEDVSPGYLFLAPFSGYADIDTFHGPRQAAPYIFSSDGELVWSGFSYFSIWATNFQAGKVNGEDVLFSFEGSHNPRYGHGHGHITFLNQNYETIKELRAGNHKIIDKHEFHIINETSGLVQIYQPVPKDLTPYGASPEQQWIVDAIFQEIDINTGEVLFEWSSLEHISPDESVLPIVQGQAGSGYNSSDAWDYFHINSVDKDENGDYLLSARDAASLYKIDGNTGEVIWKLGGLPGITSSDFKADKNLTFSFQHHARYLSTSEDGTKQLISFYDNSAHGTENKNGRVVKYNEHSSGKIIEVDTKNWNAKLLFNGISPDKLLSKSQGSTQVLANGNVLVNWGSEGAITEFKDEKPIFNAFVDSGELGVHAENYRAFKYNWTGKPNEKIALLSEFTKDGSTNIYVSWNGDTETKKWKFYSVERNGSKRFIGETSRKGFESIKTFDTKHERVLVEAYDSDEVLLSTSDPVKTEAQILQVERSKQDLEPVSGYQTYFDIISRLDSIVF
ncbi:uncharacterized protein AC631_05550 [Debaryomyces fabryi]|uniref:Arylsulfotransferase N-terminal domain-containing protein n=1 Tax=Debaryomyces fabryi TaxID=58627 RepID=A0A0V1PR30_9ASCO|nr:uncharacterized protein AC631_05550 [Debaryomyces fabryi]KRZ98693.1 hypothetical protein AC631_05550 [Debaryomyces fabryi]CUM53134.1 unnamed protein product [Debaryomyces fabryi]